MMRIWLFIMMFSLPLMVQAATPAEEFKKFIPAESTEANSILKQLFGPGVVNVLRDGATTASAQTVIIEGLAIFTTVVFALAGVFLAYLVIRNLIETANTGEVMGKSPTAWSILRPTIGLIMMIPLPALAGLSLVQGLVIFLGLIGSGAADKTWAAIAASSATNPIVAQPATAYIEDSGGGKIGKAVLLAEVCAQTANNEITGANLVRSDQVITDKAKEKTTQQWGSEDFGKKICGEIAYPTISKVALNDEGITTQLANEILTANGAAMIALMEAMKGIAGEIVEGKSDDKKRAESFMEAALAYNNALHAAGEAAIESTGAKDQVKSFKDNIANDGWVMAGSFFWRMAQISGQINAAIQKTAGDTDVDGVLDAVNDADELEEGWFSKGFPESVAEKIVQNTARVNAMISSVAGSGLATEKDKAVDESSDASLFDILDSLTSKLADGIMSVFNEKGADPLTTVRGVGDVLNSVALAAIPLSLVSDLAGTVFKITTVMGWALSTYLPLIPFIIWIMAVLKWAISLIEGLVSAPIWMAMHIAGGDGLAGDFGKNGYGVLMSIVLMPVLMILALTGGAMILFVGGDLINRTLGLTLGASGALTFFGALGLVVVYIIMMLRLTTFAFELINTLPGAVMGWIGMAASRAGSMKDDMNDGVAGAAAAGGAAGSALGKGAKNDNLIGGGKGSGDNHTPSSAQKGIASAKNLGSKIGASAKDLLGRNQAKNELAISKDFK